MNRFIILLSVLGLSLLRLNAWAQCPNDNTFYETKAAPTVVGNSITTELYGGEYSRITGLMAGKTYRISNCGDNAFDSEITIYQTGATGAIAYNDDYEVCAPQSVIYFTPPVSGDYDIVVDEYNCVDNFVAFTTVTVELFDEQRQVITIPTVVHVVYNTSIQNISDAQINSQIDVLNADFRRLNADIGITPVRFYGFSKDLRVEFCLASLDPVGAATTGITRTFTNRTGFDPSDDFMKFDADGGKDAWPRDQYMNIWVCDVDGQTLGYAQFPGEPAPTDGVVIDYEYFGTTGTATPPFNLGRTATHEVGHWLNLKHIWGDDGTGCTGSDEVNDTPNQGGSNDGCPTAPVSCSNGGLGGDMYVNYMDYSDDACLTMFTYWQYRRTEAALLGPRSGLLSSPGCGAISSTSEMGAASLLVTLYPNPASDAITVRLEGDYQKVKGLRFVITDLQGQKLIGREVGSTPSFEVDVSGLAKGIYLYQIIGDDNRFATGKLAVQ